VAKAAKDSITPSKFQSANNRSLFRKPATA
jgi:hypothetical protein